MAIHVTAEIKIPAEKVKEFKQFVAEVTAIVREKEAGKTLSYDFFSSGVDMLTAVVNEVYADADSFIGHIENLGGMTAKGLEIFSIQRMVIAGVLPGPVFEQLKSMGGAGVAVYGHAISAL
jgi:quinol monooxygenase YgiN